MPQAASTGHSCTHCKGGGVVVAPCNRRTSSHSNARRNASSPGVVSTGASPSRQTLRQLSIAVLLSWGAISGIGNARNSNEDDTDVHVICQTLFDAFVYLIRFCVR